jgi:hypothetical protein
MDQYIHPPIRLRDTTLRFHVNVEMAGHYSLPSNSLFADHPSVLAV